MDNQLNKLSRNLFLTGLFFHVLAAWFAVGYHHPDEYFQLFEFASWKLGITPAEALQWEFGAQIRPAIQPAFVYRLYKVIGNPVTVSFLLRLLSAIAAFSVAFAFAVLCTKTCRSDRVKRIILYLTTFLWFMPYIHSHFSSENWSALCFFAALPVLMTVQEGRLKIKDTPLPFLLSGILLGLSFVIRFQACFMIFGLLLWMLVYARPGLKRFVMLCAGMLLSIFTGMLADRWFYGQWISTSFNYFYINVWQGKAATFGVSPWWEYFTLIMQNTIPPFGIAVLAAVLIFFIHYYKHPLTWICMPFLLAHLVTPHKELRFLFPLVNALPVMIGFACNEEIYIDKYRLIKQFLTSRFAIACARIYLGINMVLLIGACLKPENEIFLLYNFIYDNYSDKKVHLYTLHDEPYNGDMKVYFFRPQDIVITRISNDTLHHNYPFNKDAVNLIFEDHPEKTVNWKPQDRKMMPVFQMIPAWLWHFNFNSWLSHSRDWRLYVVE